MNKEKAYSEAEIAELEFELRKILFSLGITSNERSFACLTIATLAVIQDPSLMSARTKCLYPLVAEKLSAIINKPQTGSAVERVISRTVDRVWAENKLKDIKRAFGLSSWHRLDKPRSGKFIEHLVDILLYNQIIKEMRQ